MDTKTNVPGIYRSDKGYLINKDNDGLAAYKLRKEKERQLKNIKEDVDSLKKDISEIKDLLRGLVK